MTNPGARPSAARLRRLYASDARLAAAGRRLAPYPGFPDPRDKATTSHFAYLARAILYQQLAGKAAATIHGRVRRLSGGPRFPTAEQMLALPESALRGAGVSGNKQLALRDLAARVAEGRLRLTSLARRDDATIIEALTEVRGIGVWSAQMFLMFRLGRLDVLPITDLGVQEGLRRLDGLSARPGPRELEARGEAWAPLRSVAAWILWRLTEDPA